MQAYIVTGGRGYEASTETLLRDGGVAWQYAANLPSGRNGIRGLGLNDGNFIATGGRFTMKCVVITVTLQAAMVMVGTALTC